MLIEIYFNLDKALQIMNANLTLSTKPHNLFGQSTADHSLQRFRFFKDLLRPELGTFVLDTHNP